MWPRRPSGGSGSDRLGELLDELDGRVRSQYRPNTAMEQETREWLAFNEEEQLAPWSSTPRASSTRGRPTRPSARWCRRPTRSRQRRHGGVHAGRSAPRRRQRCADAPHTAARHGRRASIRQPGPQGRRTAGRHWSVRPSCAADAMLAVVALAQRRPAHAAHQRPRRHGPAHRGTGSEEARTHRGHRAVVGCRRPPGGPPWGDVSVLRPPPVSPGPRAPRAVLPR